MAVPSTYNLVALSLPNQDTQTAADMMHNNHRPPGIERKPPRKAKCGGQKASAGSIAPEVKPPYEDNPYNLLHHANYNKMRCCTTLAFDFNIAPHIQPRTPAENDEAIIEQRVEAVFDILMLARNHHSVIVDEDGENVPVGSGLPSLDKYMQDLHFTEELRVYPER